LEVGAETVVLFAGLAVSAVTDATTGRILNMVTFPMIVLGIVIHAVEGHPWFGLAGFAAATLVHYPLWLAGIHKAGDVKLLMGLGACAGWIELAEATVWLAVFYIPVAFAILALRGRLANFGRAAKQQLDRLRGIAPTGPPVEKTWFRMGPLIAWVGLVGWLTDLPQLH
jgi:Flp pilus assembly protein protease CpaA